MTQKDAPPDPEQFAVAHALRAAIDRGETKGALDLDRFPYYGRTAGKPAEAAPHGISPEVAAGRPYVRWTNENREPVEAEYKDLPKEARSFLSRVTAQSDGWLIKRFPPPCLDADRVYAELRPDDPVVTGTRMHDHAKHFAGKPKRFLERHLRDDHDRRVCRGPHTHACFAKYLFPPSPRVSRKRWHDHDDLYAGEPDRRRRHEAKEHDGEVVAGSHPHAFRPKDKTVNYAKRLDVHPQAVPLLGEGSRTFFGIEGCLKADAILSQGEAVFSAPSVTLWDAPELGLFAEKYLAGATVFIVPDADWSRNPAVFAQAMLCRSFLQRRDIEAHVAAPPEDEDDDGKLKYKGVDDFLGAGGTVDDLVVVRRELPKALNRELREWGRGESSGRSLRIDGLRRQARTLENLILLAANGKDERFPKGTIEKNLGQLAKLMGHTHHKSAERAVNRLEEQGLITIEGSSETQPGGWKGDFYDSWLDWVKRPVITIAPHLQAIELEPLTVGELTEGIEQFPLKDIEELEELLKAGRGSEAAVA
jgi:hypothetical protein